MASSSSTDSKFPTRRAPPVPRGEKSRSSMQDLLTLGNDPFNMQPVRTELDDYNYGRRKPPPRPPPPKSKSPSNYKGLSLILGKDAAKRTKSAATAVVKPLPAAPVTTGTLIDFDSPSISPTFSKLSGDLSSVSSSDSSFNYQSKSSLLESGFDDDFDPFSTSSNRTTPGGDPWSDPFSPPQNVSKPPIKFEIAPPSEIKPRIGTNFVMPTIIGPVKLSKPKRPPLPGHNVSRMNRMNEERRDSSPPMPSAPAPPPPPEAVNILINGPPVPPRPTSTVTVTESKTPYCVAEYDYEGSHPDDLSFKEGDVISLTERLNDEWLRGRLHGVEGMFPYNYVRIVVPLDATSTPQGIPVNLTVVALFPFIAQTWDDLDLNEGDEIKVSMKINEDWLYGECNGRTGQFPACFTQDITDLLTSFVS